MREKSPTKTIYFITGASGVGKTTLVENLMKKHANKHWSFVHFDTIGVPSSAEMERDFGSPPAWQKAKTVEWIGKLVNDYQSERIFFEGQVNPQFIVEGFTKHNFENYRIILVDCSEKEMERRLTFGRSQPELLTEPMKNWLQYLRGQARESGVPILDTTILSPEEMVKGFENAIGL